MKNFQGEDFHYPVKGRGSPIVIASALAWTMLRLVQCKGSGLWDGDKSISIIYILSFLSLVLFYSRAKKKMKRTTMIWVSPGIPVKAGHLQWARGRCDCSWVNSDLSTEPLQELLFASS
jgi:hypothetical protein